MRMFGEKKEELVKEGMVSSVKMKLGYKAEEVRMEDGSIKAEPSKEFIEECGSYEEADERIEKEAKKVIKKMTGKMGSKVSEEKNEELMDKVQKELK